MPQSNSFRSIQIIRKESLCHALFSAGKQSAHVGIALIATEEQT